MIVITDDYISALFKGSNFGERTNNSVQAQRDQLAKTLTDQTDGFWSGHTAYHIAVYGGFLIDRRFGAGPKKLTLLGERFMNGWTVLVNLKIGRHTYAITKDDEFMDNGLLVQLTTQSKCYTKGGQHTYPKLSQKAIDEIAKFKRVQKGARADKAYVFSLREPKQ